MEPVRHRSRMMWKWYLSLSIILPLALIGCRSNENPSDADDDNDDAGLRKPPVDQSKWTTEEVADGGVGLFTKLALTKDGPVVAYYTDKARTGDPCTEIGSPSPPKKQFWDLYLSQKRNGSWQQTLVTPLLVLNSTPPGLDLKVAPNGKPAIASLTGAPIGTATLRYCGANDVGYFTQDSSGAWQPDTAVESSGQAAVSGDTAAASNHGEVLGFWPALAYDSSGNAAIAYRDVHTGVLQSDDWRRADLELAWASGGEWRALAVDWGRSAGEYNRLVFDKKDRPVVLYYVPEESNDFSQQGLWAARSADRGATWQQVRLFAGALPLQPDLAVDPSNGTLYVVYYNKSTRIIYLATLKDDSAFESASKGWSFEAFGDKQYDEGQYSSIAVDPDGRIGVAYYRCIKANQTDGTCSPSDNALVFAWRETGSSGYWTVEVVDQGDESGECGTYASVAFDDQGNVYIAYLCQHVVNDRLESRVHLAKRTAL